MEGSESEAVFDALGLNPQRFINEILNSVDDLLDGAFQYSLQEATELAASGDPSSQRSDELAQGITFLRNLTQSVLDKRMEMWEKYCIRHCFSVPEGFVLPKAQNSPGDDLSASKGPTDAELDSQLDFLRNKLAAVGKKSLELKKEIHMLESQSIVSPKYQSYLTEAIQLFEQNLGHHKTFQETQETASQLQARIEEVKIKRKGDREHTMVENLNSSTKRQRWAHDEDIFSRLEDIHEAANVLRNM